VVIDGKDPFCLGGLGGDQAGVVRVSPNMPNNCVFSLPQSTSCIGEPCRMDARLLPYSSLVERGGEHEFAPALGFGNLDLAEEGPRKAAIDRAPCSEGSASHRMTGDEFDAESSLGDQILILMERETTSLGRERLFERAIWWARADLGHPGSVRIQTRTLTCDNLARVLMKLTSMASVRKRLIEKAYYVLSDPENLESTVLRKVFFYETDVKDVLVRIGGEARHKQ